MKIADVFSTTPATITVTTAAGLQAIAGWMDILNKALNTVTATIAITCGLITLYGHYKRWKNTHKKEPPYHL